MTDTDSGEIVTLDVLLEGYRAAWGRFMGQGRLAVDPAEAYMPIFEALNWAAALDGRLADETGWSWRANIEGGEIVAGFRFARHRAHHQWANVLYISPGAMLPAPLPMPLYEWCWRKELPPGKDDRGSEVSATKLADVPARFTLEAMKDVFERAVHSSNSRSAHYGQ